MANQHEKGENIGGTAEVRGNDIIVTLGAIIDNEAGNLQLAINYQASTIMHELGHNLGLEHGGDVKENDKPNYYSVMNYLYAFNGLPPAGSVGDRYYYRTGFNDVTIFNLADGPYSPSFKIDFSDGTGATLNENNLDESIGIGRGLGAIDWNYNGSTNDSGISQNLNPQESTNISTLTDYDDWGNLYFTFYRTSAGDNVQLSTPNSFTFETLSPSEDESQPWSGPCLGPHRH